MELSEKYLIAICVFLVALFAYSIVNTSTNAEYNEDSDNWYIVEGLTFQVFRTSGIRVELVAVLKKTMFTEPM